MEKILLNEGIKARRVFVIGSDGEKIGEKDTKEALSMAEELGLDLVMIGNGKEIPTVKIIDKGKYLYEQKKKEKEKRKNCKKPELKEITMSPSIMENDLKTKENMARKFLNAGHELKLTLFCRGREIARIEKLMSLLDDVTEELSDCSSVKMPTKAEGRRASVILKPKNK